MPRGTRAIHKVSESPGHSPVTAPHFIVERELASTCWCEQSHVLVSRNAILDGNTGSCGRPGCEPPDGSAPAPGVIVIQSGSLWKPSPIQDRGETAARSAASHREVSTLADETSVRPKGLGPRRRGQNPNVALRRDLVQIMWGEGKTVNEMADYLDVAVYIVKNDVNWLLSACRIARRRPPRQRRIRPQYRDT